MKRELFALPNLLSLTRLLLAVPFVVVMLLPVPGARWWGCGCILLGALTDKLDGVFARRMHLESETGKIIDPLADKVGVGAIALVLLLRGEIALWLVALLLGRDLLILAGGMYLKTRRHIVVPSNIAGKWTVGISGLLLFLLVAGVQGVMIQVLIVATVLLLTVSFVMYLARFLSIMQSPGGTA
jgi:CDP-diacylglycerol--glycerol-3-phosphate 3-phosphatidyltransferase